MKKIILTEKQEKILCNYIINEDSSHFSEKEDIIIQWLNDNFKAMDLFGKDNYGLPKKQLGASILTQDGQVSEDVISLEDLFYRLQDKFKKILTNKNERNDLIKNALKKWYRPK